MIRLATTTALFAPPSVGVWYGALYGNGLVAVVGLFGIGVVAFGLDLSARSRENRAATYLLDNENAPAAHTRPGARRIGGNR